MIKEFLISLYCIITFIISCSLSGYYISEKRLKDFEWSRYCKKSNMNIIGNIVTYICLSIVASMFMVLVFFNWLFHIDLGEK